MVEGLVTRGPSTLVTGRWQQGTCTLFEGFISLLLFPSPSLLAPLYIFSTCSPYFFPLFKFSPFLFLSFLSDRKDIRDKFNVSGCLVMGVWKLKEVRGMVVSRCEKGFKSYC